MKIGRNEKCPCGSGKKYKHCCIAKTDNASAKQSPEPEEQYFGYPDERPARQSPFEIDTQSICCMVTKLNQFAADSLNHPEQKLTFQDGDYIVTSGNCSDIQLEGPYASVEEAFDIAKEKFGAIRFMGKPEFI